jgi:hypothetical protein
MQSNTDDEEEEEEVKVMPGHYPEPLPQTPFTPLGTTLPPVRGTPMFRVGFAGRGVSRGGLGRRG